MIRAPFFSAIGRLRRFVPLQKSLDHVFLVLREGAGESEFLAARLDGDAGAIVAGEP
jgi:hypothetical protein